jgi:hypothetical protein
MTREEIRQALLEEMSKPKEVRTNDGRVFLVHGVEQWALGSGRLVILEGPGLTSIAIRNIASIGRPIQRRRRRRA